ncbi:hypothetical protein I6F11_24485 [Ensifer sp. NBAIM29]|nr:hypothetical protein [Ensifer sp. NBAIM29]
MNGNIVGSRLEIVGDFVAYMFKLARNAGYEEAAPFPRHRPMPPVQSPSGCYEITLCATLYLKRQRSERVSPPPRYYLFAVNRSRLYRETCGNSKVPLRHQASELTVDRLQSSTSCCLLRKTLNEIGPMPPLLTALLAPLLESLAGGDNKVPLHLAITGHRWNRISPSCEAELRETLRDLFTAIDAVAKRPVRLLTGMAEGTDLCAALERPPHWTLEAILPLPVEGWRTHLEQEAAGDREASVLAFDTLLAAENAVVTVLPRGEDGGPDYSGLGAALVARAELLVAVWNGEAGKPGGTAEVVSAALGKGCPVLRIPAEGTMIGAPERVLAI